LFTTCKEIGITENEFWYEYTPRKTFAVIEEWKKGETEKAILLSVAQRIKNPYDLRPKEEIPDTLSNLERWDMFTGRK
jgi:hypothetical protein